MTAVQTLEVGNKIRLPEFSGEDRDWHAWSTKFEAYADLANLGDVLEQAE